MHLHKVTLEELLLLGEEYVYIHNTPQSSPAIDLFKISSQGVQFWDSSEEEFNSATITIEKFKEYIKKFNSTLYLTQDFSKETNE